MKTVRYLGFLVLALHLLTNVCDGEDTMAVGETLSGGKTLTSVNGTFKLGFFNLNNTGNWYLGIWYAQTPVMTVVWVANRDNPLNKNSGTLNLREDGNLVLSFGSSVIWSTNTSKASSVLITDAGNLIVYGADNKSEIAWESFNYPGNTWLPGMKLTASQMLIAWKSPWDPSPGKYSLQMDPDGSNQFVLTLQSSLKYWESGQWNGQIFSKVPEMTQNFIYNFNFFDSGNYKYFTYSVKDTANVLTRFVLSEVGNIQVYSITSVSSDWLLFWVQPRDQCDVDTLCGGYASCRADNVQFCSCLKGFTPADALTWQAKVWSGCVRRTALDCQTVDRTNTRTTDGFIKITGKESPVDAVDTVAENCREACLRKCSCAAYVDVGGGTCRRWFGDLVNLKDGLSHSTTTKDLFVRVAARDVPKTGWKKTTIAAVVVAFVVAVSVLFYLFYYHRRRKSRQTSEYVPASLTVFSYRELKFITKNFSERIGGGGFGSVFKGTLPDKSYVAVKKLEGSSQGEKQFRAEVSTTGIIQHVNLIKLRGFRSESAHRLLVYDYMPNGSLNSFLFLRPGKESTTLDWQTRFNIALGTARGILYLHENCRDCIIHCDIKPENILLDSDFCPKVADFGLAKLVGREFSRVLTTMRGTRGYLAPEWVFGLPITPKADVYSFGMTLLEIIAGRRNMDTHPEFSDVYFPTWAAIQINAGNSVGLLDRRLDNNADAEQVKRAAMVGGWCIQDDEDARPSMSQVVQILEGNGDVAVPPVPMSLEAFIADPSRLMGYWDKEMEAASLPLASSGRVSVDPPPSTT